ncbi:hypothetical protein B0O80DRAFT_442870 [Mortierella sp. GBAus27b]|nr:hypothetical protein B0O80DRAFT_442870 [Mortierella sp. GBAus27b]
MKVLIVLASAALLLSSTVSADFIRVYNWGTEKGACMMNPADVDQAKNLGFSCEFDGGDDEGCYYIGSDYPSACRALDEIFVCRIDCEDDSYRRNWRSFRQNRKTSQC